MSETENPGEHADASVGGASAADAASSATSLDLGAAGAEDRGVEDALLSRIEVIESQPLPQRAERFEQLHDELLDELQRGDHGGV